MAVITSRHLFGWKCEQYLKPVLEEILDEPLTKTSNRYNSIDFTGPYWRPELKSRPAIDERGRRQDSNTYSEWLIPTCKEKVAATIDGEVIFFYFWEGDNSLWYCVFEEEKFKSVRREVPFFSPQEHFFIPKQMFERVECQIPEIKV